MQLLNEQFSFLYSDYDKTQLKNNPHSSDAPARDP